MSEFCQMITQCGWCNPYCSERIKLETLRNLEKDWWGYGENSGNTIREHPTIIPADPPVMFYPQVPGITPTVIAEEVE